MWCSIFVFLDSCCGAEKLVGFSRCHRGGQQILWLDSCAGPSVAIAPRPADLMVGFSRCHCAEANYFSIDSCADCAVANYFNIDSCADCAASIVDSRAAIAPRQLILLLILARGHPLPSRRGNLILLRFLRWAIALPSRQSQLLCT